MNLFDRCTCSRGATVGPRRPHECLRCWKYLNDPKWKAAVDRGSDPAPRSSLPSLPSPPRSLAPLAPPRRALPSWLRSAAVVLRWRGLEVEILLEALEPGQWAGAVAIADDGHAFVALELGDAGPRLTASVEVAGQVSGFCDLPLAGEPPAVAAGGLEVFVRVAGG